MMIGELSELVNCLTMRSSIVPMSIPVPSAMTSVESGDAMLPMSVPVPVVASDCETSRMMKGVMSATSVRWMDSVLRSVESRSEIFWEMKGRDSEPMPKMSAAIRSAPVVLHPRK